MNFIITASFFDSPQKFHWKDPRVLASLGGAVALLLALGLGLGHGVAQWNDDQSAQLASLQEQLDDAQARLNDNEGEYQRELNALAVRMAELQAQTTRLNALGSRLSQMGALQDGEFDFDQPLGMGGPEALTSVQDSSLENVEQTLDWLAQDLLAKEQQLTVMESILRGQDLSASVMPSLMPVEHGHVSSGFGYRHDPFSGKATLHSGVDFSGKSGSKILAAADGVVSFNGWRNGYGNVVEIDHGSNRKTRYAHNKVNLAVVGTRVRAGDVIARMGSTGRSTGTHLHFEVLEDGRPVNPKRFLAQSGIKKPTEYAEAHAH